MICALDIDDHLSANMRIAEESRLVLEAEYSGHSRKKCLNVSLWKPQKQTFKSGSFTNFKPLFPVVLTDFSPTGLCQKLKKP